MSILVPWLSEYKSVYTDLGPRWFIDKASDCML